MSYVIRNCPCNVTTEDMCDWENTNETYCKDCADCVMKQIVENLRQVAYACHCDNCDGCGYYSGCSDTECGTYQALKSLYLLYIQEVE